MSVPHSLARHETDQRGFTLIELMIVVAIISILAMIAMPQYQNYSAKATLAAALAEIAGGKIAAETLIAEGYMGDGIPLTPADLGLPDETSSCSQLLVTGARKSFDITCHLKSGNKHLSGRTLRLSRVAYLNSWACYFNGASHFTPPGCETW